MKFSLINTVYDAVYKFETVENRSTVYRALDALLHKDVKEFMDTLSEFADSEKTEEDYNRFREAVVGVPLPQKPTTAAVLTNCLNGQYGRGPQLIVERLKTQGPSRALMIDSIITLMKPYGFVLSEHDIAEAVEQL
jgi:hypothetical protein